MASQSGTGKAKTKTASKSKQPEPDINKLINIAFDLCCKRNSLSEEEWKKAKEEAKEEAMKEFDLKKGDLILITGGFPLGKAHSTNHIRILEI